MGKAWKWIWGKRWRRVAFIAILIFPVFSIASVEATSQSRFCSSCHIMDPYYASWKVSAHKDVECVKCHISPGATSFVEAKLNGLGQVVDDVLHRTSPKPSASVNQLSCTRSGCHSVEQLSGKTINNGRFKFRHDKHLGRTHLGVEFTCSTCHSHVQGDEHFEVNTSVCLNCHLVERTAHATPGPDVSFSLIDFKVREGHTAAELKAEHPGEISPPSACTTCHDAPTETIERGGLTINHSEYLSYGASCESCHHGATATPQPIEDGRCLQCHNFGIDHSMSATEMHKIHAEGNHKIECFSCHGMIEHGPSAQIMSMNKFDCQQCHVNEHSIQQMAYLSRGQSPDPDVPPATSQTVNPMFMAHVDCTGCHVSETPIGSVVDTGARVVRASAKACDKCHKPGMGEQTVPLWQKSTKTQFAADEQLLAEVESLAVTPETKQLLAEATDLLGVVEADGSWGVHNPTYTQRLLEQARTKLIQIREAAGVSP